jgi:hypothetical protein
MARSTQRRKSRLKLPKAQTGKNLNPAPGENRGTVFSGPKNLGVRIEWSFLRPGGTSENSPGFQAWELRQPSSPKSRRDGRKVR